MRKAEKTYRHDHVQHLVVNLLLVEVRVRLARLQQNVEQGVGFADDTCPRPQIHIHVILHYSLRVHVPADSISILRNSRTIILRKKLESRSRTVACDERFDSVFR